MRELWTSPYFGIAVSVLAFWAGEKLQKKLKSPFCNPLLFAILAIVLVLLAFDIPYESYNNGGAVINMFLAPGYRLPGCIHLHPDSDSEGERHSDSGGLHRRLPVLHGQRLCALPALWPGRGHDCLPSAQIHHHAHCGGGLPEPRRYRTGNCHRCHLHRNPGQHPGSLPDPHFPGEDPITAGLAIGAAAMPSVPPRPWSIGETEGSHERTGHRRVRDSDRCHFHGTIIKSFL